MEMYFGMLSFLKKKYVCILSVTILFWIGHAAALDPDQTIKIPMRDGFELQADLYLPEDKTEKHPCILIRCPAGRKAQPWQSYSYLKKFGYVVAIQDTRSACDPEGKTFPYYHDGWGQHQDGYDTVEWLSKSPWTNGKIGTLGVSAAGITQLLMAASSPPSLLCQYIGFAASNMHSHGIYPGGVLLKNQVEGWLSLHAKDKNVLDYVYNHPFYNEFWAHFDANHVSHRTKVPAILYTGWYDTFLQGTLDAFVARQNKGGEGARGKQKLLIGPWTHYWPLSKTLGDFEVPAQGRDLPMDLSPERWFDYYLKGKKNDMEHLPTVTYYVMGPLDGSPSSGNVWRTADQWPVPAKETPLYLTSKHALANTPSKEEGSLSFTHNPQNPVPTLGGRNLFLESGAKDQRPIESRSDVLVFTTEPYIKDVEITGNLLVKLFFSSNTDDTDVVVRLTDVYPDGRSILLADGIYRTGFHRKLNKDTTSPNIPSEITIDLWSGSFVIAKGHSLRISIAGSNYPRYEVNKNTHLVNMETDDNPVITNKVYFGKTTPSRILLPITREQDEWVDKRL